MDYSVLDEQIAHLIDQYKAEAEETLRAATLEDKTAACLSNLIADNVTILNNIRMAVSDYLEKCN